MDALQMIGHFQKNEVTFDMLNGEVMVNATEMAKPFGEAKKIDNFLRLKSTKEFIDALRKSQEFVSRIQSNSLTSEGVGLSFSNDLLDNSIIMTKMGQHGGTYMCEELAIYFAQWLSPHFAVWISQTVRKILFGNSAQKIRTALVEIPKIYAEKLRQEKALREKRLALLGDETIRLMTENAYALDQVSGEIHKITHFIEKPTMFDNLEELGRRIVTLVTERIALEKRKIELEGIERRALNNSDYQKLLDEVEVLRSGVRENTMLIKKNDFGFTDN